MGDRRKKIAVICSTDYNTYPVGGMMSFVKDSAPMLSQHFDVDFWGIDVGAKITSFDSHGQTFPFRSFGSLERRYKFVPNIVRVVWKVFLARKMILAEGYDGLYFHGVPLNLGFPGKIKPKRINHVHGLTNPFSNIGSTGFMNSLLAKLYDRHRCKVVSQSDLVLLAADHVGIKTFRSENPNAKKIKKIENFCDTTIFNQNTPTVKRANYGLSSVSKLIVHVGRFAHQKDPLLALHAFAQLMRLQKSDDDIYLIMIGDGPLLSEGKTLAHELGIAENIRFLGNQPRDVISRWLASSDLYLYTSFANGYPITLAEAAQSGLPIVSTAVTGVHDLVRPGENGGLVISRDPKDFVDPLEEALNHHDAYGKASLNLAAKFTPDTVLTKLIEEIRDVL